MFSDNGYFHATPSLALIPPIMTNATLAIASAIPKNGPITTSVNNTQTIAYNNAETSQLATIRPCSSSSGISSFLSCQITMGAMTPERGMMKFPSWDRCRIMAQVRVALSVVFIGAVGSFIARETDTLPSRLVDRETASSL